MPVILVSGLIVLLAFAYTAVKATSQVTDGSLMLSTANASGQIQVGPFDRPKLPQTLTLCDPPFIPGDRPS